MRASDHRPPGAVRRRAEVDAAAHRFTACKLDSVPSEPTRIRSHRIAGRKVSALHIAASAPRVEIVP